MLWIGVIFIILSMFLASAYIENQEEETAPAAKTKKTPLILSLRSDIMRKCSYNSEKILHFLKKCVIMIAVKAEEYLMPKKLLTACITDLI